MHQLCFQHMLNYPLLYSLSERKRGSKHTRNYVYLSKIKNSSCHQQLVLYLIPEHVDALRGGGGGEGKKKQVCSTEYTLHNVDLSSVMCTHKKFKANRFIQNKTPVTIP